MSWHNLLQWKQEHYDHRDQKGVRDWVKEFQAKWCQMTCLSAAGHSKQSCKDLPDLWELCLWHRNLLDIITHCWLLCLQPPSTLSPGQKACRDITPFTYSGEILHSQNADPKEIPSQTRKFTGSLGTYNFTHAKAKSRRTQLYSPAQIIIIKKKSKTKPKGQPNTVWTSTFVWFTTAANLEDIKKNNNKTSRS